jgi:hypothetical protein
MRIESPDSAPEDSPSGEPCCGLANITTEAGYEAHGYEQNDFFYSNKGIEDARSARMAPPPPVKAL